MQLTVLNYLLVSSDFDRHVKRAVAGEIANGKNSDACGRFFQCRPLRSFSGFVS